MAQATEDEGAEHRRLAFLLFKKAGERKFAPIGREEATQLLGKMEHACMGMGSSNLLVPQEALQEAGVDVEVWKKAEFREVPRNGRPYFEVPAMTADLGVLPVLRLLSGGVEKEMAEIDKRRLSSRDTPAER
jgi:hypothetical protein